MDELIEEIEIEKELTPLAENLPKVWDQFEHEIENYIESKSKRSTSE